MSKLNLLTNVFQFQSSVGKATSCSTCNVCWISSFISKSVIRGIRREKVRLQSTCLWAACLNRSHHETIRIVMARTHTQSTTKPAYCLIFIMNCILKITPRFLLGRSKWSFINLKYYVFFSLTVESTLSRKCKLPLLCLVSLILHFLACVWNDEQQLTEA